MTGFKQSWKSNFELRNIIIIIFSLTAFVLISVVTENLRNNFIFFGMTFGIVIALALILLLFIFSLCSLELCYFSKTFDNLIYMACLYIFCISVIIAALMREVNVIVASATLLLVIISAYSVTKTNEIAQKQLKFQIEPKISMSIKENEQDARENEVDVQIIDLVIENIGIGIAKNIQFDIQPHGFITLYGYPLEKLYFFQKGIPILGSKQKYVIPLTHFTRKIYEIKERFKIKDDHEWHEKLKNELELTFNVYYENIDGELSKAIFRFNLCMFWRFRYPGSINNIL